MNRHRQHKADLELLIESATIALRAANMTAGLAKRCGANIPLDLATLVMVCQLARSEAEAVAKEISGQLNLDLELD